MLGQFYTKYKGLHLQRFGSRWTTGDEVLDVQIGLKCDKPKLLLTTQIQRDFVGTVALFSLLGFYITKLVQTSAGYVYELSNGKREILCLSGDEFISKEFTKNLLIDETALAMGNAKGEYRDLLYKMLGLCVKSEQKAIIYNASKKMLKILQHTSAKAKENALSNMEMGYSKLAEKSNFILEEQKNKFSFFESTYKMQGLYDKALLKSKNSCFKLQKINTDYSHELDFDGKKEQSLKEIVRQLYKEYEKPISKEIVSLTSQQLSLGQTLDAFKMLTALSKDSIDEGETNLDNLTLSISPKARIEVENII